MQTSNPLQKVILLLEEQGYTDDQVGDICGSLTKNAFSMLYTKAVSDFLDEDFQAIEDCASDEEANKKIMDVYTLRTGQDPYADMHIYLKAFAQTFLNQQKTI
ncbi:MAG: hypothetical protein H0W89_04470 [Candidatus Levybacteria bacterium]|nr:hypothetical protein [Candidatus Levybacteria bacterium]